MDFVEKATAMARSIDGSTLNEHDKTEARTILYLIVKLRQEESVEEQARLEREIFIRVADLVTEVDHG